MIFELPRLDSRFFQGFWLWRQKSKILFLVRSRVKLRDSRCVWGFVLNSQFWSLINQGTFYFMVGLVVIFFCVCGIKSRYRYFIVIFVLSNICTSLGYQHTDLLETLFLFQTSGFQGTNRENMEWYDIPLSGESLALDCKIYTIVYLCKQTHNTGAGV